jgi:hypothetical protein
VGYDLLLKGNAELQDISQLAALVKIKGELMVEDHPLLRSLSPLPALQSIGGLGHPPNTSAPRVKASGQPQFLL